MEFEKNSTKILNLQSCGTNTNTNFMCTNCVRKHDSNYFMPPPFPYLQYPPKNFWEKMYQNEVSPQCNCQNSKSGYSGSFFSPFPIYLPVFYNPAAHMFTNNNCKQCSSNANCSQSTQTDQCVSIQNNETVYENKSKPKLNYESTKKVFSRKSSFEDNTVGKSSHQLQDRGDKGAGDNENDIDGSEYNSIKNTTKDKFIRICEDKNSYYEKEKSSSEDDGDSSYNDNNDNENRLENSTQKEKAKICRNDTPKFCPPAQNETAALCMLSLLTRHKTAMDMAPPSLFQQPQTFPQFKSDCLSRDMKRSELKDSPSDNYLMSPARNNSIHKVPNALQQNDHLKSGSPRAPVKLRTNHNI